jgi:hypothetical protein
MLPGLRFLFAAIVLSTSVLIFGLGAAALLRAAHEEVANIPARRSPPEPVFAQAQDAQAQDAQAQGKLPTEPPPTIAMLRVEPPVAETPEKAPDSADTSPAPIAPTADASAPAEPEQVAAVKPDEPASTEAPAVEAAPVAAPPVTDAPAPEAPPAAAQTDTPAPATEEVSPTAEEAKPAAVAEAPPASDATPSTPEQPATADESPAAAKIATLGGPAVTVEEKTSAKKADAKPDQSAAKKRARAERARERRRLAQQQRPAHQVIPQQQQYDVFGQPIMMRPTR